VIREIFSPSNGALIQALVRWRCSLATFLPTCNNACKKCKFCKRLHLSPIIWPFYQNIFQIKNQNICWCSLFLVPLITRHIQKNYCKYKKR
jgi:hypothetical protein